MNPRALQNNMKHTTGTVLSAQRPFPFGQLSFPLWFYGDGMGSLLQHQIYIPSLWPESLVQGWVHALIQVNQNLI